MEILSRIGRINKVRCRVLRFEVESPEMAQSRHDGCARLYKGLAQEARDNRVYLRNLGELADSLMDSSRYRQLVLFNRISVFLGSW